MSFIRRVAHEATRIPAASKFGFVVIVLGLVADLVVHLTSSAGHDHGGASGTMLSAHLVVFVGMMIVLLGVIFDGVRSTVRAEATQVQGRPSDAIR